MKCAAALLLALVIPSHGRAESRKVDVALLDLQSNREMQGTGEIVSEMLRVELVKTGAYNVIDQKYAKKVMKKKSLSLSGVTDRDSIIKIGGGLDCRKLFVGQFTRLAGRYIVTIQCVDVETGRVDFADSIQVENEGELPGAARLLAAGMETGWYRYLWWGAPRYVTDKAGRYLVTEAYRETEKAASNVRIKAKSASDHEESAILYEGAAELAPDSGRKVEATFMNRMMAARTAELEGKRDQAIELYSEAEKIAPTIEDQKAVKTNLVFVKESLDKLVSGAPTVPMAVITTVAGTGRRGYAGDKGPAVEADLNGCRGITVDQAGNLFISDSYNSCIRKVSAGTGIITTIAGTGIEGYGGDGQAATDAQIDFPTGGAVDRAGNLYFADSNNNRIRKVDRETGVITTIAGTGVAGYGGDGEPGINAALDKPLDVFVDRQGNIFIADYGNNRIRRISAKTGIIVTIAGSGAKGYSGDGGPAGKARLSGPCDVAVGTDGTLYFADTGNNCIRKVVKEGVISPEMVIKTVAGTGNPGNSGDGGKATSAKLHATAGLAVDEDGNLYFADTSNHIVRKVSALSGRITSLAGTGYGGFSGDGGPARSAQICSPCDIAVSREGDLFIADTTNDRIRKVTQ